MRPSSNIRPSESLLVLYTSQPTRVKARSTTRNEPSSARHGADHHQHKSTARVGSQQRQRSRPAQLLQFLTQPPHSFRHYFEFGHTRKKTLALAREKASRLRKPSAATVPKSCRPAPTVRKPTPRDSRCRRDLEILPAF